MLSILNQYGPDMVTLLGVLAAFGAFNVALREYRTAQKWKSSELAAKQLEMLSSDPKLVMCCRFLDWAKRTVPVPAGFKIYTSEESFKHEWGTLTEGMRPESEGGSFPFPQVLYRDYFDYFFTYLERVNHYIEINLFTVADVSSLRYWLGRIAFPPHAPKGRPHPFRGFVEGYGYTGVVELMKRFSIPVQWTPRD